MQKLPSKVWLVCSAEKATDADFFNAEIFDTETKAYARADSLTKGWATDMIVVGPVFFDALPQYKVSRRVITDKVKIN